MAKLSTASASVKLLKLKHLLAVGGTSTMGISPSALIEKQKDKGTEAAAKMEADLATLERLLDSRANEFYLRLVNSEGEDKTVPIKTIIDYKRHISCSVSNEPSEQLNTAIEEMFGGNFLQSLKAMCLAAGTTQCDDTVNASDLVQQSRKNK